jgi:hypothetical protein
VSNGRFGRPEAKRTRKNLSVKRGTKLRPGTRRAEKYQDGAKKSGGANTTPHAGPKRASKTAPTGTNGAQFEKRLHP